MAEDKRIRYIVKLKDDFHMWGTTINNEFCGAIENITGTSIYFMLNGCNALVIVPHNKIKWMAPSKIFFEKGYNKEDVLLRGYK